MKDENSRPIGHRLGVFLQIVTIMAIIGTWFFGSYEVLKWERDAATQRRDNQKAIVLAMSEINELQVKQAIIEDFLKRKYPVKFPYTP